jgi:hypothetical protein
VKLLLRQALDDGDPCGVEMRARRRRATTSHSVRLLDQGDADASRKCCLASGYEVSRGDPSARAVTEDERGAFALGV